HRARGVLARGPQRRLVAGRPTARDRNVLQLHRARARRIREGVDLDAGRLLSRAAAGLLPPLRRAAARAGPRRAAPRLLPADVRGRGRPRALEPRGARARLNERRRGGPPLRGAMTVTELVPPG